jgi:hypothetical protein
MRLTVLLGMIAFASSAGLAQGKPAGEKGRQPSSQPKPQARGEHPSRPEVGGGHVPARAPGRTAVPKPPPRPSAWNEAPGHPNAPHYDAFSGRWYGHDVRRDEDGLRLEHPWAFGHFMGEYGPRHVYRLRGGGTQRFGFDGFFFSVALVDVAYANDWMWDNDDIVLYDDLDHPGYYLAYNVRTGTYVHVEYLGR